VWRYKDLVIHVEEGSNLVKIIYGCDFIEIQFWEFCTKFVNEFSRAYSEDCWTETAPLGQAAEDVNLITGFYESIENPNAHFSGVSFEEVSDLSCDVVVFEGAGSSGSVDGGVCGSEVDEATVAGNTTAYMASCICRLVCEPCCADVRVSYFSVNCDRRDSMSPSKSLVRVLSR